MAEHLEPIASAIPLERTRWGRVVVAVVLAGTVPAVFVHLFVLYGLNRTGTQLVDFLLHLIPLFLGAWAATAWHETQPRLLTVLGILAGAVEVLVTVAIFSSPGHELLASTFDAYTVPASEDSLAVLATVALFTSGAFIADRRKRTA